MNIALWSLLLIVQNGAFTWVSRARNGGSYGYHAIAAFLSNGIFFSSQFILITLIALKDLSPAAKIGAGLVYAVSTTIGSVLMHYVSVRWLEKGKRKVGA